MQDELKVHWDSKYLSTDTEKLGWYEAVSETSLKLIGESVSRPDAHIFVAGAGSSSLLDDLVKSSYTRITACDISQVALDSARSRLGEKAINVRWIADDLTKPLHLDTLNEVDFWHDRAVLHFFIEPKQRMAYFDLIAQKVVVGGYVMLAAFSEDEKAMKCSNLPVMKYNSQLFQDGLGDKFEELKSFHETYCMPNGETRDYIFGLFRKKVP